MIGMARRIDQLGRLVVPSEFRRMLGIVPGDLLDMRLESGRLIIDKISPECAICNRREQLIALHDKHLCQECAGVIRRDISPVNT
jgi:transcriptional pleiotropic regulator of transition state genes